MADVRLVYRVRRFVIRLGDRCVHWIVRFVRGDEEWLEVPALGSQGRPSAETSGMDQPPVQGLLSGAMHFVNTAVPVSGTSSQIETWGGVVQAGSRAMTSSAAFAVAGSVSPS